MASLIVMDGSLSMACAKLLCHYIINIEQKTYCIWRFFFSAQFNILFEQLFYEQQFLRNPFGIFSGQD